MKSKLVILVLLLICVAGFIFYMSSRDVDQSLGNSTPFDRLVASVLVDGFDEMTPEEQYAAALQYDEPIRHVAHAVEFFALGALLALICLYLSIPVGAGVVVGASYGVFDEVHQIFVEGRGCQLSDMGFDFLGVVIGTCLALLIYRVLRRGSK